MFLSRFNEINGGCEKILDHYRDHSKQHMAVCGLSLLTIERTKPTNEDETLHESSSQYH